MNLAAVLAAVDSNDTACVSVGWLVIVVLILVAIYLVLKLAGKR